MADGQELTFSLLNLCNLDRKMKVLANHIKASKDEDRLSRYCSEFKLILAQFLDSNRGEFHDQICGLQLALHKFNENKKDTAKQVPELVDLKHWLFMQCAKLLLSNEWQNVDENDPMKQLLLKELSILYDSGGLEDQPKYMILKELLEQPWTNKVLVKILSGYDDIEESDVFEYFKSQDKDILRLRVDMLLEGGCDSFAVKLTWWLVRMPEFHLDASMLCIHFMLLHKLDMVNDFHQKCSDTPCHVGVQILHRMSNNESLANVTLRLSQTFLAQDLFRPVTYCCTKELLQIWAMLQRKKEPETEAFITSIRKMSDLVKNSLQMSYFVLSLKELFGATFLALCIEFFTKAFHVDVVRYVTYTGGGNEPNPIDAISSPLHMCHVLNSVLDQQEKCIELRRLALVAAFSMYPTDECLYLLESLYLSTCIDQEKTDNYNTDESTDVQSTNEDNIIDLQEQSSRDSVTSASLSNLSNTNNFGEDTRDHENINDERESVDNNADELLKDRMLVDGSGVGIGDELVAGIILNEEVEKNDTENISSESNLPPDSMSNQALSGPLSGKTFSSCFEEFLSQNNTLEDLVAQRKKLYNNGDIVIKRKKGRPRKRPLTPPSKLDSDSDDNDKNIFSHQRVFGNGRKRRGRPPKKKKIDDLEIQDPFDLKRFKVDGVKSEIIAKLVQSLFRIKSDDLDARLNWQELRQKCVHYMTYFSWHVNEKASSDALAIAAAQERELIKKNREKMRKFRRQERERKKLMKNAGVPIGSAESDDLNTSLEENTELRNAVEIESNAPSSETSPITPVHPSASADPEENQGHFAKRNSSVVNDIRIVYSPAQKLFQKRSVSIHDYRQGQRPVQTVVARSNFVKKVSSNNVESNGSNKMLNYPLKKLDNKKRLSHEEYDSLLMNAYLKHSLQQQQQKKASGTGTVKVASNLDLLSNVVSSFAPVTSAPVSIVNRSPVLSNRRLTPEVTSRHIPQIPGYISLPSSDKFVSGADVHVKLTEKSPHGCTPSKISNQSLAAGLARVRALVSSAQFPKTKTADGQQWKGAPCGNEVSTAVLPLQSKQYCELKNKSQFSNTVQSAPQTFVHTSNLELQSRNTSLGNKIAGTVGKFDFVNHISLAATKPKQLTRKFAKQKNDGLTRRERMVAELSKQSQLGNLKNDPATKVRQNQFMAEFVRMPKGSATYNSFPLSNEPSSKSSIKSFPSAYARNRPSTKSYNIPVVNPQVRPTIVSPSSYSHNNQASYANTQTLSSGQYQVRLSKPMQTGHRARGAKTSQPIHISGNVPANLNNSQMSKVLPVVQSFSKHDASSSVRSNWSTNFESMKQDKLRTESVNNQQNLHAMKLGNNSDINKNLQKGVITNMQAFSDSTKTVRSLATVYPSLQTAESSGSYSLDNATTLKELSATDSSAKDIKFIVSNDLSKIPTDDKGCTRLKVLNTDQGPKVVALLDPYKSRYSHLSRGSRAMAPNTVPPKQKIATVQPIVQVSKAEYASSSRSFIPKQQPTGNAFSIQKRTVNQPSNVLQSTASYVLAKNNVGNNCPTYTQQNHISNTNGNLLTYSQSNNSFLTLLSNNVDYSQQNSTVSLNNGPMYTQSGVPNIIMPINSAVVRPTAMIVNSDLSQVSNLVQQQMLHQPSQHHHQQQPQQTVCHTVQPLSFLPVTASNTAATAHYVGAVPYNQLQPQQSLTLTIPDVLTDEAKTQLLQCLASLQASAQL